MVVVDDGDGEAAFVADESNQAGLFVICLRGHGRGPTHARNLALKHVETEIVGLLDDDSVPEPEWAEACVGLFEGVPAVTAQLGRIMWRQDLHGCGQNRSFLPRHRQKISDARYRCYTDPDFKEQLAQALGRTPPGGISGLATHLTGANAAVRTAFIREHGGFDPRLATLSDKELAWRILRKGGWIAYNPDMVAFHDHDPSITRGLLRAVRVIPFQEILATEYRDAPWRFLREDGRGLVQDELRLNWGELAYESVLRVVRRVAKRLSLAPHPDPLASGSRRGTDE